MNKSRFLALKIFALIMIVGFFSCEEKEKGTEHIFLSAAKSNNLYPERAGDLVFLSTFQDGDYSLSAFNTVDKKLIWTFNDKDGKLEKQYTNINFYSYANFTAIPMLDQILIIDNDSAKHLDTIQFEGQVSSNLFGLGKYVYPIVNNTKRSELNILSYDLVEEKIDTSITLKIADEEIIISIGPIISPIDSTIFYNSMLRFRPSDNTTHNYLLKWNREQGIIDSISISEINFQGLGVTRPPLIDTINGVSFWHRTNSIAAFNHHTDTLEWFTNIGQVSLVSRPVFFFDKIIYPTEKEFFLVIDKFSGNIVDTIYNTPSFPGRMSATNDKLFFIGGVDGELYTIEKGIKTREEPNFTISKYFTNYEGLRNHQHLISSEYFIIQDEQRWIFSNFENLGQLEIITREERD